VRVLRPLLLVIAALVVYARTFGVPFVFDDVHAIVQNLRIRELSSALLAGERPLVDVTLALNYAAGGLHVGGYHVVNLLLHLVCAWLLFDLARRTFRLTHVLAGREDDAALFAALVFVVHPLQTESVTYVISRSELLMAVCYLTTLDLVARAEMQPESRPSLWAAAILACAIGMTAKPIMATAPLAVWWLARCVLEPPARAGLSFGPAPPPHSTAPRRVPLFFGLASTWMVLVVLLAKRRHPGAGFDIDLEPLDYLRTQLGVTWHYFRLLVWPRGQTLDYDWPLAVRWTEPTVVMPAIGWILVMGLLLWLARRGRRAAAFWLGFAVLALLPSSSLVPIADLAFEHRMYLTVGGFAVLTAVALGGLAAAAPRLATAVAVVIVVSLAAVATARNELWRDPVALWTDALAKAPAKQRVYRNLAEAYQRRGDQNGMRRIALAEADALERLHHGRPHDARILTALGNALARLGRIDEALAAVSEALRLDPRDPVSRAAQGGLLMQLARPEEAIPQLEMAEALIEGRTGWSDLDTMRIVQVNLGWAYAAVGRNQDALRVLREAAADDNVSALNNLGSVLGRVGEWDEAKRVLERAQQRDPEDPNVQSNLGWVYANLGRLAEADALLEHAILQQPSEPSAHGNLGWVRLRAGNATGAVHALEMALSLQPDNPWALNMLGVAHARLGQWERAARDFERAIELVPDSSLARGNLARVFARQEPLLTSE
jgi:protein O-mannosyl-transferase